MSPEGSAPGGPEGAQPQVPVSAAPPVLDPAQMQAEMGEQALRNRLVTYAYGTKLPQQRTPEEYEK
jgi:hypothetical protein